MDKSRGEYLSFAAEYTEYCKPAENTAVTDAKGYTRGAVKSELKQSGYNPTEKTFSLSFLGM